MGNIVTFVDGPAEGESLDLRRAPYFLRVVRGIDGKWDALDQLDDDPAMGETIFIYKARAVTGIFCGRGKGNSGRMVEYVHTEEIKPEGMEDRDAWQAAVTAACEREEAARHG
jgi:hypothetical protein